LSPHIDLERPVSERAYAKLPSLATPQAFREYLASLGADLPCDDRILPAPESPLAQPLQCGPYTAGNRWCIQPMEGWDGTTDGKPTEYTVRRWQRFGESGAKLIWGGEAVAVTPDGRANPNQLMINEDTVGDLLRLRETLVEAHRSRCGTTDDLVIGLQLTHSGRFCRPYRKDRMEPRILFPHPLLNRKFGIPDDYPVLTDDEIRELIEAYHRGAELAARAGFQFVDIKHCHGYLGHEFLAAHTRPGPYGGSFENRTRFLREIVEGIRARVPELVIGVRLSGFDWVPFRPDPERSAPGKLGPGIPEDYSGCLPYRYGFGVDPAEPVQAELSEPEQFLALLVELGIPLLNLTAGSPYYNPHLQRPAIYPPSDGYQPPEDPLVGCARQIQAVRQLKAKFPQLAIVGTAYTYLQEYLPHVAQAVVREGWVDAIGLGRMVLSYPELPLDTLTSGEMRAKQICRTFSDCTTAPRNGMVSGCYPLDPYYKNSPLRKELQQIKLGKRG
jgi:2,4-dienoyl-CoA reductase-like NADH-dependent reductase (Old Yellow Enzyme family)